MSIGTTSIASSKLNPVAATIVTTPLNVLDPVAIVSTNQEHQAPSTLPWSEQMDLESMNNTLVNDLLISDSE